MSSINEKKTKELEHICQDAKVVDTKGCQPILCASDNPDAGIAPQISVPLLSKGDVCIATTFYSTAHSSPDCNCDLNKMYNCPYKKSKEI